MQPRTSVGRDFQDNILVRLMERRSITTIYLRNRMTLRGRILRFDPFVLLLDPVDGSPPQLVYKSSIVSISGPRQMGGGGGGRGPGGPRPDRPRFDSPRPFRPPAPGEGPRHDGSYGGPPREPYRPPSE